MDDVTDGEISDIEQDSREIWRQQKTSEYAGVHGDRARWMRYRIKHLEQQNAYARERMAQKRKDPEYKEQEREYYRQYDRSPARKESRQRVRDRQKSNGFTQYSCVIEKDTAERFAETCKNRNETQRAVLSRIMRQYVMEEQNRQKEGDTDGHNQCDA